MSNNLDIITEKDQMLNWIYDNSIGDRVLVVGCANSDEVIRFAREFKEVVCIDDTAENIELANQALQKENDKTIKFAEFRLGSLFTLNFKKQLFDSIIFDQSLTSVTEPERHLRIAESLLNDDGQVIITLPFGLHTSDGETSPYYLLKLNRLAINSLRIDKIKYVEGEVGLVLRRNLIENDTLNSTENIKRLEETFYRRELIFQQEVSNHNKKYSSVSEKETNKYKEQVKQLKKDLEKVNAQTLKMRKNNSTLKKKLLGAYKEEEKVLLEYKVLLKKYESLSNSKLGRVTLAYWRWRAKRRKK